MQRLPGYAQQGPYSNSPSYERTSPDSFPRGMHNPAMGDYPVGKLVLNLPFLALFMSQNYAFYSCLKMHFYWKKNTFWNLVNTQLNLSVCLVVYTIFLLNLCSVLLIILAIIYLSSCQIVCLTSNIYSFVKSLKIRCQNVIINRLTYIISRRLKHFYAHNRLYCLYN